MSVVLESFNPKLIKYQYEAIKFIRSGFDYSKGPPKILCSGAVGSGKTTFLAHAVCSHAVMYPNSRVGIGRLSMKYLKGTLFKEVVDHLGDTIKFKANYSTSSIKLENGSEILSFSWADKKYKKVRSYAFSAFAIEELTESKNREMFDEIYNRLGRLKHVPETWLLAATNPDEPDHWAYKEFFEDSDPMKKVFLSKTKDNSLLPPFYEKQLRKTMDPLMARRMLDGEWLSIAQDVIYHQFSDANIIKQYKPSKNIPIWLSWDFNIGNNKPMSVSVSQFKDDTDYIFDEVVLDGMRTQDTLDELFERGYFNGEFTINVCADATGSHRDTRGVRDDISIIKRYLSNLDKQINFRMRVPRSNPPIRQRHNLVNAYLKNANNEHRMFFVESCKNSIKAMRYTKLASGAQFKEDDSKPFQHVGTAIGYALHKKVKMNNLPKISQGGR